MCQGKQHEFLQALPKCEHHMHLEGSLSPELLFTLARRNNIDLPSSDPAFQSPSSLLARYRQFTSLDDFLHYYFIGMSVLMSAADFESLTYDYFRIAHSDGVLHAEVFFDPQVHMHRGVPYAAVVEGITRGRERAMADFGISSEIIVCVLRHLPVEDGHAMYTEHAVPDLEVGRVKGLGLSSTELGNLGTKYTSIYSDAENRGFNLTAHAGEEGGVEYMASALYDLHVTRVDHGIKLGHSPELMREFVDRNILVTLCPMSNVELKCVTKIADLPLRLYLDQGVKFSINSDDPAYFGGYILENYCQVQDAFSLTNQEWGVICGNAIEGSWCTEERKSHLRERLASVLQMFEQR
ncbi:adenosine deaminase [Exophiala mesophila]|uniref:Adenine deaminase n=1 Tax=Exophiala mesophila TaxID=212818 RepID=A0A0D1X6C4_EXOME|nr:adenosine deaminase [Exophiala mesophila]KIV97375.1 adenosine deaminase [Exophiala mesophila]